MFVSRLHKLAEVVVTKHDVDVANIGPGYKRDANQRAASSSRASRVPVGFYEIQPASRAG